LNREPERACCCVDLDLEAPGGLEIRVHEDGDGPRVRNKSMQERQPFPCQLTRKNGDAGNIAAGSAETRDEAEPNRIIAAQEHDGNRAGRRLDWAD
jgi:hypothetical protein